MSAAPALFKWIRSRHPGVSRRQRSSSAGAEGREGEVRVVMLGKVAGWAAGLKSSRSRLKPRLGGEPRSGRGPARYWHRADPRGFLGWVRTPLHTPSTPKSY